MRARIGVAAPKYGERMPTLKDRLRADLNTAMKARDEVTTATLRMALPR
jgi:hypothetical protein